MAVAINRISKRDDREIRRPGIAETQLRVPIAAGSWRVSLTIIVVCEVQNVQDIGRKRMRFAHPKLVGVEEVDARRRKRLLLIPALPSFSLATRLWSPFQQTFTTRRFYGGTLPLSSPFLHTPIRPGSDIDRAREFARLSRLSFSWQAAEKPAARAISSPRVWRGHSCPRALAASFALSIVLTTNVFISQRPSGKQPAKTALKCKLTY